MSTTPLIKVLNNIMHGTNQTRYVSNIVGVGRGRIVYNIGNGFVLKVAKSKYGIRSNKTEARIYKSVPLQLRKHLGMLIKHTPRWVVMKKYDQRFPKSKGYKRKLKKIKFAFKKKGIIPYELFSRRLKGPNRGNLRLDTRGRIIVIDYGNFQRKRRKRKFR